MDVVKKRIVRISPKNPSLQRIEERCINCGMCLITCEMQTGIDHAQESKDNPLCINCGQCILHCPVGALCTKYNYKRVLNVLKDTKKRVALSFAPAIRVSLASEFGIEEATNLESILPTIARKLGFDYVFDVTFGADVTIMEESSELINRLEKNDSLPMFTSCCPAWVKYAKLFHPELLPNISTTKSPIAIQSTLIKTYFKEINNITEKIISVVVAPCTAKKYEIKNSDTDYIITTQELAMMIRESNIDITNLLPSKFDALLGKGSKAGTNFGRSGGVMTSALSYVYYLINKKDAPKDYFNIEIEDGITKKSFKLGEKIINIAIISGMKNLEELLLEMHNFDFIEVMNCPNGCVGGGGQPLIPIKDLDDAYKKRSEALKSEESKVDCCYQNKEIIELYSSYLDKPNSKKAENLLHNS